MRIYLHANIAKKNKNARFVTINFKLFFKDLKAWLIFFAYQNKNVFFTNITLKHFFLFFFAKIFIFELHLTILTYLLFIFLFIDSI